MSFDKDVGYVIHYCCSRAAQNDVIFVALDANSTWKGTDESVEILED